MPAASLSLSLTSHLSEVTASKGSQQAGLGKDIWLQGSLGKEASQDLMCFGAEAVGAGGHQGPAANRRACLTLH